MSEYKLGDTDLRDYKIDPNYKKGFEHGYWLQRGESQDLDPIIDASKPTQYKSGLMAGKKEATREQVRDRIQGNKDQSQSRDKGMDMD